MSAGIKRFAKHGMHRKKGRGWGGEGMGSLPVGDLG